MQASNFVGEVVAWTMRAGAVGGKVQPSVLHCTFP